MRFSLSLGRIFGIPVTLHWSFLLLLAYLFLSQLAGGATILEASVTTSFLGAVFGCVLMHEFGHSLAARRYGIGTRSITLWPIGGIAQLERMPREWRHELVIALAGPAVNAVIVVILLPIIYVMPGELNKELLTGPPTVFGFLVQLAGANLILAVFNLIPAFPMDGGRVLRAILSAFSEPVRATHIAARVGQVVAVLMALAGWFFLGNPFLIIIAIFVIFGAEAERRMVSTHAGLSRFVVGDLMSPTGASLESHDSLAQAVNVMLRNAQDDLPIFSHGELSGYLTRADIRRGLRNRSEWINVQELAKPDFAFVEPTDSLETAMEVMRRAGQASVPVMMSGQLIGIIQGRNIEELIALLAAQPDWDPQAANFPLHGQGHGTARIVYQ